jgi:predicted metalloprotease with PDZ domain
MIKFDVELNSPHNHVIDVVMTVEQLTTSLTLNFPTWIPGSYLVRDFSKHIQSFSVKAIDNKIEIDCETERLNNNTYIIKTQKPAKITVSYQVYAWDYSVRQAYIDTNYAFFNGTSLFFEVSEFKSCQHVVNIHKPKQKHLKHWRLATTMPRTSGKQWEFGCFTTPDYQTLIDFPVIMGEFEDYCFTIKGVSHYITIVGAHRAQIKRLVDDVKKICNSQYAVFDDFPFDEYLFMLLVSENGYGGLEHINSTLLMCSRNNLPVENMSNRKEYITLLGLFSHEYFHAWNIKKIKPENYIDLDLSSPAQTKLMWAFEGITSYYDDLALIRSGVITREEYLTQLCQSLTNVVRSHGRLKQTITESSFDAWTKFYQQNENSPNSIVSYYTKGSLIALICDLYLRFEAPSASSLDMVMKKLWKDYGSVAKGVKENTIQELLVQLGGNEMHELINSMLETTNELPLEKYFSYLGLELYYVPTEDYTKFGEYSALKVQTDSLSLGLGIKYQLSSNGLTVLSVYEDSAAANANIWAQDIIIAIDKTCVTTTNYEEILNQFKVNDSVLIHYIRKGGLNETSLNLQESFAHTAMLCDQVNTTEAHKKNQSVWLESSAQFNNTQL